MWTGEWSHIRILFFLSRYSPFLDMNVVIYRTFISQSGAFADECPQSTFEVDLAMILEQSKSAELISHQRHVGQTFPSIV